MVPEPESLDAALLSAASPWKIPVPVMDETTSSNDDMLRLGEEGSPNGTLLFAERQTAGRGRFQRPWLTAPGLGLCFSLLLRLEVSDATIPSLSAFAAVALVEAISELGIKGCAIKAPNDILIGERKVAGILVETRIGKNPFAVVGVGLNVNQSRDDFPVELQGRAGSLAISSAKKLSRNHVAAILLKHLGEKEHLMRNNPDALLAAWNEMLMVMPAASL